MSDAAGQDGSSLVLDWLCDVSAEFPALLFNGGSVIVPEAAWTRRREKEREIDRQREEKKREKRNQQSRAAQRSAAQSKEKVIPLLQKGV